MNEDTARLPEDWNKRAIPKRSTLTTGRFSPSRHVLKTLLYPSSLVGKGQGVRGGVPQGAAFQSRARRERIKATKLEAELQERAISFVRGPGRAQSRRCSKPSAGILAAIAAQPPATNLSGSTCKHSRPSLIRWRAYEQLPVVVESPVPTSLAIERQVCSTHDRTRGRFLLGAFSIANSTLSCQLLITTCDQPQLVRAGSFSARELAIAF